MIGDIRARKIIMYEISAMVGFRKSISNIGPKWPPIRRIKTVRIAINMPITRIIHFFVAFEICSMFFTLTR